MIEPDYYFALYANGELGGAKHYRATIEVFRKIAKSGPNPIIGVWRVKLKCDDKKGEV